MANVQNGFTFLVQGCGKHLAHQERQNPFCICVKQVLVHNLLRLLCSPHFHLFFASLFSAMTGAAAMACTSILGNHLLSFDIDGILQFRVGSGFSIRTWG
jgi:hypothetical protein